MMKRIFSYALLICILAISQPLWAQTSASQKTDSLYTTFVEKRSVNIAKRADGFIVYNGDTLRGYLFVSHDEVDLEHPLNAEFSRYYNMQMHDRKLTYVMMYNHDKKPLALTRVKPGDRNLMRIIHEGKMNIYDDRINYIYNPEDIDKNMIVISFDGIVEDLTSFLTETTKRDLIDFINDVYGTQYNPKQLTWKKLLTELDKLD